MRRRVLLWLKQILLALDATAQTLIVGPFFVVGLTRECPIASETISSYVGRAALAGRRWARPVAWAIDGLFRLLGEAPGHCLRNVVTARAGEAPTP